MIVYNAVFIHSLGKRSFVGQDGRKVVFFKYGFFVPEINKVVYVNNLNDLAFSFGDEVTLDCIFKTDGTYKFTLHKVEG